MPRSTDLEKEVVKSVRNLADGHLLFGSISQASRRFLTATSLLPISDLGYWERTIRSELSWASYRQSSLDPWIMKRPHGPWLNLFNGDGFRREEALDAIAQGAPNAFLFSIMLRRLNDWVPQVRAAARRSIKKIALETGNEIIVEALWGALPHLHSWGRWHDADKDALIDLAYVGDVPGSLASRIIRSPSGPAPSVLSQATRRSALDGYLAKIATESIQPAVRARAYKIVLDEQAQWLECRKWVWTDKYWCKGRYEPVFGTRKVRVDTNPVQILRDAAEDRSPAVRRIAGATVIARLAELGKDALPLAKHLAADPYPSIAERGQFALDRIT